MHDLQQKHQEEDARSEEQDWSKHKGHLQQVSKGFVVQNPTDSSARELRNHGNGRQLEHSKAQETRHPQLLRAVDQTVV